MRYHIRKKAAIKIGLVIIAMVFILPFLVSKLERSSSESEALNRRRKKVLHDTHVAVKEEEVNNVVDNPMEVKDQKPPEPQHTYGPTAVLKPGVLGNFEPVDPHPKSGPGEGGQAVYTGMEEKIRADQSVREFGFNMVNSDKIAMNRTIPDTRLDECKYWQYPTDLPTASVILVFHNEGWSTLVRTVHSVINTSPPNLLHEVVMVDDFSDKDHLKGRLEEYIKQFNGKVKLYRNTERMGLIGTRTRGAELSKGDVIVFLDAHCECNKNWLVPLLARIRYDRTIMTVPTIDIIDSQSFSYYSIYAAPKRGIFEWGFLYKESRVPQQELNKRQHESEPYKTIMAVPTIDGIDWDNFGYHPVYSTVHHRGIFEWGFLYKESQVPKQELDRRQHNSEPYKAPTHAGGLFAMDRKYFFEMGAYDPGLKIWGGENFELSFKLWQCGGSIEWVPCSRVGHVYRNHMPYGFGKVDVKIPLIQLNYMRVVEVWLDDEFKEYFYTREPAVRGYPVGDISQQLKFKKDHNCKSFKWFMENVAYEVYERFPPLPPNKAWGEFKTKGGNKCWDLMGQQVGGGPIGLSYCHHFGGNQMFRLNTKGQIGVGERCIKASGGTTLHLTYCDVQPTGPWSYDENTGVVREQRHDKCVEAMSDGKLMLQRCIAGKPTQKWEVHETFSWKR